jgi:hypothetical protein
MKANAIRLYKHFCEMIENPKGTDLQEKTLVRSLAKKSKANMENHFRTSKKYANDPEIQALLQPKEEVKEVIKEEKSNGKKSKR